MTSIIAFNSCSSRSNTGSASTQPSPATPSAGVGATVDVVDQEGFRYALAARSRLTRLPQVDLEVARPGSSYIAGSVQTKNLQTDRSAPADSIGAFGSSFILFVPQALRAAYQKTLPVADGSCDELSPGSTVSLPTGGCVLELSPYGNDALSTGTANLGPGAMLEIKYRTKAPIPDTLSIEGLQLMYVPLHGAGTLIPFP